MTYHDPSQKIGRPIRKSLALHGRVWCLLCSRSSDETEFQHRVNGGRPLSWCRGCVRQYQRGVLWARAKERELLEFAA